MRCDRIAHPPHIAHLTASPPHHLTTSRPHHLTTSPVDELDHSKYFPKTLKDFPDPQTLSDLHIRLSPSQVSLGCALHSQLVLQLIMAATVSCRVSLRSSVSSPCSVIIQTGRQNPTNSQKL